MTNEEILSRSWKSCHNYLVKKRGFTNNDANAEINEMLRKTLPIEKLGRGYGGTIPQQIKVVRQLKKEWKKAEN